MATRAGFLLVLMTAGWSFAVAPASGLSPGEEVAAWEPIHVAGPHAGTRTCPVCTYLDAPVLLAFARNVAEAGKLAKCLADIAEAHQRGRLKVILVVLEGSEDEILRLAKSYSLQRVMLCRPDPERRQAQLKAYKVDPAVSNTIMLYQDYRVRRTWNALAVPELPELAKAAAGYLPRQ